MKMYLFICIPIIMLLGCNKAEQNKIDTKQTPTQTEQKTEPKTTQNTSVANTLNIKIPESTDPELNEFFILYTSHLNEYLPAVRENNKSQMEASFQKEIKFRKQLLYMPERIHKINVAEWEKYQNYRQHTMNYWNEIEESDYVKQLHDEAFKKNFK
jgi:hypothetical protein